MAEEILKKLSTDDIAEVATEDSVEFAIARIAVLSTRPNSHKMKITEDVLREYSKTMLGKWVVADYSKWRGDVTTHTISQNILGVIPKDQEVEFVRTEDGYLVAYVQAVLSKIYATDEYKLFTKDNFRNVSIEMGVKEHEIEDDYNKTEVDAFVCYGVTVLGQKIAPSCPDAHITITQFSEQNATDYYTKEKALWLSNELKRFAQSLDNSKDNNDERTNPMEDNKLEQFAEENDKKDVVMEAEQPKGESESEESKEMAEPKEGEAKAEDNKDMSAESVDEDADDLDETEDKKDMSCGGETEKMDCGGEDKKFSLEQFASEDSLKELSDEMAELVKMESADEVIAKFAEIMKQNKELSEKNAELVEFQNKTFEAERDAKVNKILAEVKEDLSVEQFTKLEEEAKTVEFDAVDAFANKVKAFAYEASKNKVDEPKNEEGITLMASAEETVVEKDNDVFSRLSKKYK
ncbi:MAG: hypothetical protein VZR53_11780 [Prevotella sp.]|nr:hypothetical protein [Prevotella sp.]